MAMDIQIMAEGEIIRAVYRGKLQFDLATEMLRKVAQIASDNQSRLLLFDIRSADYQDYSVGALKHAEQGPSLGLDQTFRVAFLGSQHDEMLQHIENVSVNRGYLAKVFIDDSEAVAWLRSSL
jgi:hypothetical protein